MAPPDMSQTSQNSPDAGPPEKMDTTDGSGAPNWSDLVSQLARINPPEQTKTICALLREIRNHPERRDQEWLTALEQVITWFSTDFDGYHIYSLRFTSLNAIDECP